MSSAAARLYYAEKGSKQWKRFKEAAVLNLNQQEDILYFCLVDLDNKNLEWKQEIYLDFKLNKDADNFYSFEGDEGMFVILFVDSQEAQEFYETLENNLIGYTAEEKIPKTKSKSSRSSIFGVFGFGRKSKKSESSSEDSDTSTAVVEEKKKTKTKKEKKKDADLSHDDVSEPRDFTHLSHIGFNPEKGTFDIQNIPDDWKTLFAKAGITQDQLQNRSTAKFIAGFVQDSEPTMREIMQKKKKPPVPVPMKKKAAPPPPPTPTRAKKQAPTSPLKSSSTGLKAAAAPPPPPPKKTTKPITKTSTSTAAPPPPPPPAPQTQNSMPKAPIAPSTHSALLESIRGAGVGILKPVNDTSSSPASSAATTPTAADPHSALMASIKNGANLKPAPKTRSPSSPTSSVSSTDPTDMMAAMLAKALAARNKKLAADSSDEDEDSDDSRW